MVDSVEDYYLGIENNATLSDRQLIGLFGHFLQIRKKVTAFTPQDIDACFLACHLQKPSWTRVYLNGFSKKGKDKFIKKDGGYALTHQSQIEAKKLLGDETSRTQTSSILSELSGKVIDETEKAFLDEAILCFKARAHRATIVMVWVLTIDHLYRYVLSSKAPEFNAALAKLTDKKLQSLVVRNRDDLTELKESKFIELLKSAQIIDKDVRKILDEKLGTRNSAAHPSSTTFSARKTEEFVEDLITNVILKHPII